MNKHWDETVRLEEAIKRKREKIAELIDWYSSEEYRNQYDARQKRITDVYTATGELPKDEPPWMVRFVNGQPHLIDEGTTERLYFEVLFGDEAVKRLEEQLEKLRQISK